MGVDHSKPSRVAVSVPVTLNIYDMGTDPEVRAINRVLKVLGTGAFHCGVEIYGREWSFQGKLNGDEGTGVFWCRPRECGSHTFHESIEMGQCNLSEEEVLRVVSRLQNAWPGKEYDILRFNCCHFVDAFLRELGMDGLPAYIMSLAGAGAAIADAGEYFETQSKAFAADMALSIRSMREGVKASLQSSAGCMPSLCNQAAAPSFSRNAEEVIEPMESPRAKHEVVSCFETPRSGLLSPRRYNSSSSCSSSPSSATTPRAWQLLGSPQEAEWMSREQDDSCWK